MGIVVHTYNSNTQEAKEGKPQISFYPTLFSKFQALLGSSAGPYEDEVPRPGISSDAILCLQTEV